MAEEAAVPVEPWTPIQVERKLAELFNAVAQAELAMRKLLETEAEAKLEYERAYVIAAHDPDCPVPSRATEVTVGQREDWIRGFVEDEMQGLKHAQLNLDIQKRYIERLNQQVSIVQTMSKHVLAAYQSAGSMR